MSKIDLNLSARERVKRGRYKLQNSHPFFSNLALHLKLQEDKNIPTMGVSAKGILYYNSDFIKDIDTKYLKGLVAHEALHVALNHTLRRGNKDARIWNIAIDYVANGIIRKNNLSLPDWSLYEEKYVDKDAESVYSDLLDNSKKIKQRIGKPDSKDSPRQLDEHKEETSSEKKKEKTREWEERVEDALNYSKQRGELPKGMDRFVSDILDNKLDYRKLLRKYIQQHIPFDYTWKRPAKKSFATGIYFPKSTGESLDLIVAIDSSGSITEEQLSQFLGEINAINQDFQSVNLRLIIGDTKLQEKYSFRNRNQISPEKVNLAGGGGTDHHWVFQWVKEHTSSGRVLVAFTDGYTNFPQEANIDTIWVTTGLEPEEYPFGKAVKCDIGKD